MKMLVVGGTGFLGGAIVDEAIAAGHDVTVFSRGQHSRKLSKSVKILNGDRHGDTSVLEGQRFDFVADTCAFAPEAVSRLLDTLSSDIGCYALVSSASVYDNFSLSGIDEDSPTPRATNEQLALAQSLPSGKRGSADDYGDAYGPLKRESEIVALDRLGHRAFILRSGLLSGVGDYTDRLTYWVRRVDQGERIAAPGDPQRLVQLIDVRDAAAFIVAGASRRLSGIFNLTGKPFSMAFLLQSCCSVAQSNAELVWIAEETIKAAGIEAWTEFPLWLPSSDVQTKYFLEISTSKAFACGLKTRPLNETLMAILSWDRSRRTKPLKSGVPPLKEALLLSKALERH
jgi:2'-hydroxyisoflavone reductase